MKINKVLIVLLLPFIAGVVVSCCNCDEPLIRHYTNKTIAVKNIDNSGSEPVLTTANAVPKEAFGIRIELNREKTACLTPSKSIFIQAAYATSCDCPPPNQWFARDSVLALQVFTVNDFDVNHPAASDVSQYFKVFQRTSFSTIDDFLERHSTTLYSDSELETSLDLLLMTPPVLNKSHSFKIKITLSDGRTLEGTTASIDLT